MHSLIQKSFGSKQEYYIKKDSVFIRKSNINKVFEYSVKFDELGFEIATKKTKSLFILIPVYFAFTVLNIYVFVDEYNKGIRFPELFLYIFGIIMFGAGFFYSFYQTKETVYLTGGSKTIDINGINPSKETVEQFIADLHSSIKLYLKNKYGLVDEALTEEDNIHNIKWLNNIGALDFAEYQKLISEIKLRKLF